MNTQPDDFEQLRKLLALKRHEVPSPGYFHSFSGQVIARLQSPEPARVKPTWLQMLGLDFDLRPAYLCAAGVVVCTLLSVAVIGATQLDPGQLATQSLAAGEEAPVSFALNNPPRIGTTQSILSQPEEVRASTAPMLSPFERFDIKPTRVSFPMGGN
jgi:hypothetical protein